MGSRAKKDTHLKFSVEVSMVEVYMEKVRHLPPPLYTCSVVLNCAVPASIDRLETCCILWFWTVRVPA